MEVDDVTLAETARAVARIESDVREMRSSSTGTATAVAVMGEKVDKLEKAVYGAIGLGATALVGQLVQMWR